MMHRYTVLQSELYSHERYPERYKGSEKYFSCYNDKLRVLQDAYSFFLTERHNLDRVKRKKYDRLWKFYNLNTENDKEFTKSCKKY